MSAVKWKLGLTLSADVDSVRDYTFDFTEWLAGETLTGVVATATGCTAAIQSQDTTSAKVRVSAVTAGAKVRLRATTNSGQVEDFTTNFSLIER